MARDVAWRKPLGSLNYIETSTWARQEHNGFSHQNPSFIGAVLNLKPQHARVYLPPDGNCLLYTLTHCMGSKDYINLIVGSKNPTPIYLSADEAEQHCKKGVSIWKNASTHDGEDPDVVIVGIGVELTFEVVKAAEILTELVPDLRLRVVNVTDLMILSTEGDDAHALTIADFDKLFTNDKPIHFNYHGYAGELKGLLFDRPQVDRITIESYREEGSTTTPFHMMLLNHVSRYHVAEHALKGVAKTSEQIRANLEKHIDELHKRMKEHTDYILDQGKDRENTYDNPKFLKLDAPGLVKNSTT